MVLPLQINVYYLVFNALAISGTVVGVRRLQLGLAVDWDLQSTNKPYLVDGDELFGLSCSKSIYLHIEHFLFKHHCTQYPLNLAMIANFIEK